MKKKIIAVVLATVWISAMEFVRNQLIFKSIWVEHYEKMGLVFPSDPGNGAVWGIWSLCFALAIFIISRKFSFWQSTLLAWFVGFVLMWLVIGNMDVLPYGILPYAIPLSFIEVLGAVWISKRLNA